MRLFHEQLARRARWSPPAASPPTAPFAPALQDVATKAGTTLVMPPPALCTDNGAMIAWAGAERMALGMIDGMEAPPRARWLLDANAKAPNGFVQQAARDTEMAAGNSVGVIGAGLTAPRSPVPPRAPAATSRFTRAAVRAPRRCRRRGRIQSCPASASTRGSRSHRFGCRRPRRHRPDRNARAKSARGCKRAGAAAQTANARRRLCQGHRARHHIFMTEVIAEVCRRRASDPVRPELRRRRRARPPTAVTLAAKDETLASHLVQMLGSSTFRPYHTTDVRGVEIGGAAKNVLAIAAGIVVGRKLGASAQAALTTRGF